MLIRSITQNAMDIQFSIRQFPSPEHPYIAFPSKNLAVLDISRFTFYKVDYRICCTRRRRESSRYLVAFRLFFSQWAVRTYVVMLDFALFGYQHTISVHHCLISASSARCSSRESWRSSKLLTDYGHLFQATSLASFYSRSSIQSCLVLSHPDRGIRSLLQLGATA